jgi:hypothetical protein
MLAKRFKFYLKSAQVINLSGNCSFVISQQGEIVENVTVPFENNFIELPVDAFNGDCKKPKIVVEIGGKKYCQMSCSPDQYYDEIKQICVENCKEKYGGLKDYYNVMLEQCEPRVVCDTWKEVYDPVNNICEERIISNSTKGSNPPVYEEEIDDSEFFDNIAKILPKPSCEPNGVPDEHFGCKCNSGWETSPHQNFFSGTAEFCTQRVVELNTSRVATFSDFPPYFQITIITIFILISCCCFFGFTGCLVYFMYKRRRRIARLRFLKKLPLAHQVAIQRNKEFEKIKNEKNVLTDWIFEALQEDVIQQDEDVPQSIIESGARQMKLEKRNRKDVRIKKSLLKSGITEKKHGTAFCESIRPKM